MSPETIAESGWVDILDVVVKKPLGPTTLKSARDSVIDFFLVSKSIETICGPVTLDLETHWYPHYGLKMDILMSPRRVTGTVLVIPKPLPLSDFCEVWELLTEQRRNKILNSAHRQAQRLLLRQKSKTGVAILGKPIDALRNDPKCQGATLADSVTVGERMALTALKTEIAVLITVRVPVRDRFRYFGRSQYPRFQRKCLVRKKRHDNFSCPHLTYWYAVSGSLARLRFQELSDLATAIGILLGSYSLHITPLSSETIMHV